MFNQSAFAFLLCQHGADVDAKDSDGETPLAIASGRGNLKVATVLLAEGANITAKSVTGRTPLHFAAQSGHLHVVTLLTKRGAQMNAKDNAGYLALHYAAKYGHLEVATFLYHGKTDLLLHLTAMMGNTDSTALLLKQGKTDVNKRDDDGMVPLHHAATHGHTDLVSLLLWNGADVNAKDNNGMMPLHMTARMGHVDVAALLLKIDGVDVDAKDSVRPPWSPRLPLRSPRNLRLDTHRCIMPLSEKTSLKSRRS